MVWLEAAIETAAAGVEPVCGLLLTRGVEGVEIADGYGARQFLESNRESWDYAGDDLLNAEEGAVFVKFYAVEGDAGYALLADIQHALDNLRADLDVDAGALALTHRTVDDAGWADGWKRYYKPFAIGRRVVIRPEWEPYAPNAGELVVTLNPGSVFGTGLHQSTRLVVEQLEGRVKPGDCILDLGCGSGILGIAALKLGAARVIAVDRETAAAEAARANAAMNGYGEDAFAAVAGDAFDEQTFEPFGDIWFHGLLANIVADAVIGLTPFARRRLAPGGVFIASGVIRDREQDVRAALAAEGFSVAAVTYMDEWVCLAAAL